MVTLSSQPTFNESILVDTTLKLITKIVKYPMLTNQVFSLEKNKIYFEEIQIVDLLQKYYSNLQSKDLLTPVIKAMPISRDIMLNHTIHLPDTERLSWLESLGKPQNKDEMKRYSELFIFPEELAYIN